MTQDQLQQYEQQKQAASLEDHKATIRVPIATFPPSAMVYSINKPAAKKVQDTDMVSPSVVAKVLEQKHAVHKQQKPWTSFKVQSTDFTDQEIQTDISFTEHVLSFVDTQKLNDSRVKKVTCNVSTQTDVEEKAVVAQNVHMPRTRRLSSHSSIETVIL